MDRRTLLTALGGSASVGLSGCVFVPFLRDDGSDDQRETTSTQNESQDRTEEDQQPRFEVTDTTVSPGPEDQPVPVGTEVDVTLFVENQGGRTSTQGVGLFIEVLSGLLESGDTESIVRKRNVTIGGGQQVGVRFEDIDTGALGPGTHRYLAITNDNVSGGTLQVGPTVGETEFEATSTDGWAWLCEPDRSNFPDDLPLLGEFVPVPLPPNETQSAPVEVTGRVDGSTWESTAVTFPKVLDFDVLPHDVDTPEGLSGTFDPEAERFTLTGPITVALQGTDSYGLL